MKWILKTRIFFPSFYRKVSVRKVTMHQKSPLKSGNDYRKYRTITLDNGIQTLLVSDLKNKKEDALNEINESDETYLAAAALCIGVGSFNDPDEVNGLAHFLEHMVFMGSTKYPDENEYDSFIKSHGGSDNACTMYEKTIFNFEIQPENFEDALDRFAQFFISPLLLENAVEREIKAVDSEFKENLPRDSARSWQLLSHIAKKQHPFSKFLWGNKLSLADIPKNNNINVMEKLRSFFDKEYSNNPMTLTLCSTESLDDLEILARKYFADLKCSKYIPEDWNKDENPFELEQFHKLFYVVPVKDIHLVKLSWILPSQYKYYKCKPCDYLSWLIGHECKGSIYSYLKKLGYAVSLSSYPESMSNFAVFEVSVELTEEGLANVEIVIHTIFQYIAMLGRHGVSKDIFDEISQIDQCYFDYLEPSDPVDYVEELVENMQLYGENDYISGSYLMDDYDPKLIESMQSELSVDKVSIVVQSKKYENICTEEEPWFTTKYKQQDIPSSWICPIKCSQQNLELHLPEQNRFIAENFDLNKDVDVNYEVPMLIEENDLGKVWFKPDSKFMLPKARIYLKMTSKMRRKSSYHFACCDMMDEMLYFNMKELLYEGEVALINYYMERDELSNVIIFDGFNDKLKLFFQNVADVIGNFDFTDKVYNTVKATVWRSYRNKLKKSHKFMRVLRLSVLQTIHANPVEGLKQLEELTPQKLKDFAAEYCSQLYVESLFQGNITKEEAKSYQEYLYSALSFKPLLQQDQPKLNTLKLPVGRTVVRHNGFNTNDPNTSIQNYYQIGEITLEKMVMADIIDHIMDEPIFDILRTQWQLGYTVYSEVHDTKGVIGFSVTILTEAGKFDADYIDEKIEEFLKKFHNKLLTLTTKEYETYITSFVKALKQADLTLYDETSRNWSEISKQEYIFDRRYRKISIAESISIEEITKYYEEHLINTQTVRLLTTQVIGHKDAAVNGDVESETGSENSDSSDSEDEKGLSDEEIPDDGSVTYDMKLLRVVNTKRYDDSIIDIKKYRNKSEYFGDLKMKVDQTIAD